VISGLDTVGGADLVGFGQSSHQSSRQVTLAGFHSPHAALASVSGCPDCSCETSGCSWPAPSAPARVRVRCEEVVCNRLRTPMMLAVQAQRAAGRSWRKRDVLGRRSPRVPLAMTLCRVRLKVMGPTNRVAECVVATTSCALLEAARNLDGLGRRSPDTPSATSSGPLLATTRRQGRECRKRFHGARKHFLVATVVLCSPTSTRGTDPAATGGPCAAVTTNSNVFGSWNGQSSGLKSIANC
jgi:hypothetical protein